MPLAILWTNLPEHKFSDSIRHRLVTLLSTCVRKPTDEIGLVVQADNRCSLGTTLHEPAIFISFKASNQVITALDNMDYADRICAFMKNELGVPSNRVMIQFEPLEAGNIGFCGTTKLDLDKRATVGYVRH